MNLNNSHHILHSPIHNLTNKFLCNLYMQWYILHCILNHNYQNTSEYRIGNTIHNRFPDIHFRSLCLEFWNV